MAGPTTIDAIGAWSRTSATLTGTGESDRVSIAVVTASTFALLGATPLLGQVTVYERVYALVGVSGTWPRIGLLLIIALLLALALNWLLHTDLGLALRAVGANPAMAEALGIRADNMRVFGLVLANGLVGLAGALVAQLQGFADVGMGVGTLVGRRFGCKASVILRCTNV